MNPNVRNEKATLRNHFRGVLSSLSFGSLIEKSEKLSERFHQEFSRTHSSLVRGKYLVSFYPFGTEPQINIETEGGGEDFLVSYVRILNWSSREMEAFEARRDLPGQWEDIPAPGGGLIFQPTGTQPKCEPGRISVILVPALSFTRDGVRLGRGAGFYDRFLQKHPDALRVGIAFEEQMCERLPEEEWDEAVDLVLTDRNLYATKSYVEWQKHGKVKRS